MILLPCSDFSRAAISFTDKALHSQIEEAARTLDIMMEGETVPPENSGWDVYPFALATYGKAMVMDYELRSGTVHQAIEIFEDVLCTVGDYSMPWWMDKEPIHLSHQGVMGRKKLGITDYGHQDLPLLRPTILFGIKVILVEEPA